LIYYYSFTRNAAEEISSKQLTEEVKEVFKKKAVAAKQKLNV
jgi:hypothetical protein